MNRMRKEQLLLVGILAVLGGLMALGLATDRPTAHAATQAGAPTAAAPAPKAASNSPAAAAPTRPGQLVYAHAEVMKEKYGVEFVALRRSAGGYMLDFRYRVLDPEKAKVLSNDQVQPYLVDQASGRKFLIPAPPKVGQLRTKKNIQAGRIYFMFFANPAKYVQSGSKVSVVIGDFKAEDLIVQ